MLFIPPRLTWCGRFYSMFMRGGVLRQRSKPMAALISPGCINALAQSPTLFFMFISRRGPMSTGCPHLLGTALMLWPPLTASSPDSHPWTPATQGPIASCQIGCQPYPLGYHSVASQVSTVETRPYINYHSSSWPSTASFIEVIGIFNLHHPPSYISLKPNWTFHLVTIPIQIHESNPYNRLQQGIPMNSCQPIVEIEKTYPTVNFSWIFPFVFQ